MLCVCAFRKKKHTPAEVNIAPWWLEVGRVLFFYWEGSFSGAMFNFGILRECMLTSYVLFGCSSWGSSVSIPYLFDKWVKKSLLMFAACWMFLIPFGNLLLLHCDFIDFLNVTFFRWFLESWYCWKNGSLLHGWEWFAYCQSTTWT